MTEIRPFPLEYTGDMDRALGAAIDLYSVEREGWKKRGVSEENRESVGEHTEALTEIFNSLIDRIDTNKNLDRRKMLRMIQTHDWPEAIAGDQIAVDYDDEALAEKVEKKRLSESEAMKIICKRFSDVQAKKIMALWQEYEDGQSQEAQIIYQLDKLQAVQKARKYEKMGEPVKTQEFIDYELHKNRITNPVLVEEMAKIEKEVGGDNGQE